MPESEPHGLIRTILTRRTGTAVSVAKIHKGMAISAWETLLAKRGAD